jgi:signal transduction histidine kinase
MFWLGMSVGTVLAAIVAAVVARDQIRKQTARARDAEGRARNAQRLAEIGAMTGGLAHEIKNPLSTIGLNAQLLAEGIADLPVDEHDKGRLVRRIDSLRREVERLRDTLADFLKFAGNVRLDPRPVDVNAIVEELADFYMPQAAHRGVSLRTDLAPGPLTASLDGPHFKQALLNLMINATQAMEDARGGTGAEPSGPPRELLLKTSRTTPGRKSIEAPTVDIHVIDTGPGIAPETLARIFTPYFTTKSGGSGLGLPTAQRLIEEHGGRIQVFSEPGKGSDFVIRVPAL